MPKIATHVRMEPTKSGGNHEHISGVCTKDGTFHTRKELIDSLDAGTVWKTEAKGQSAAIRKIAKCKHAGCTLTPYVTTDADDKAPDNLDNLPHC